MLVNAFVEEHAFVLRAAAEAVVESLVTGAPLSDNAALAEAFQDALLAENADASEVAAERCKALRSAFAKEVSGALALHAETVQLAAQDCGPGKAEVERLRVEIRGTAGRALHGGAFVVGRAAECDVQAAGDRTVLPVQCVLVPLPAGVLIADFWSGGGTRITWRGSAEEPASPISSPAQRAAFVVARDERVVLRIGARTTITLGPRKAKRKEPVASKPEVEAAAPRARAPRKRSRSPPPKPKSPRSRITLSCSSTSFGSLFTRMHSGSSCRSTSSSHQLQGLQ